MWRKLWLILWKNLIIRKRHWLLTLVEILIPILLFSLVAYGRSKVSGMNKIHVEEPTYYKTNSVDDIYSHLDVGELQLWYSPFTDFSENIIKRVQEKLQITGDAVKDFESRNDLLQHFAKYNSTSSVAAVIFNGNDPKRLNYDLTISDKYFTWNTDKLFFPMFLPENDRPLKYLLKGYAALQMAIDTSYIELLTDRSNITYTFSLQQFPDPPRTVDSGFNQLFIYFLPLITIFSFIFLCPAVLQRVGEEKFSGMREYMKMVGLKSWMIWLGWFVHALIINLPSIAAVVVLMKVPLWGVEYSLVEYSDGTILYLFLFMYCMAAITFCFFLATIFKTPSIATVLGILLWIFSYFIPQSFVASREYMQWKWKILFAIFPNMALHYGYSSISVYEMREVGIQWQNIFQPGSGDANDITMGNVLIMFIVDMCLFMLLTLYIENVNPGEYGIAKPYSFPLTSVKNFIINVKRCLQHRGETSSEQKPLNYPDVEAGTKEICIQIRGLSKKYYNHIAVDNIDMDIYKNHITVLLGQNGAGKTTTMSILTGMINATSGHVIVNGKNINKHTDDVRKLMGLCTQHNLLFPDLTVMEHLQLFAMLKGSTDSRADATDMLQKLGIYEKKNSMTQTLSGGMKRKLCLGIALIGRPEVLILDEPTSGIDPESRRKVWNLLLEDKKSKTILITTHFMEEADVLGERIAIMSHGRIQCYGTPAFLKAKYNTGNHLSLLLESKERIVEITKEVKKYFDDGKLLRENEKEVVYVLPIETDKTNYKNLVAALEQQQENWGIQSIQLNETTLNDVFLKAKDELDGVSNSDVDLRSIAPSAKLHDLHELFWNPFLALLVKRWYFLKRKFYWFIPAIVVALLIFGLSIWLALSHDNYYGGGGPPLNLTLEPYGKPMVYYGHNSSNHIIHTVEKYYSDEVSRENGNPVLEESVSDSIIKTGVDNIALYKKHLVVAAEFNYTESENRIIVNSMFSPEALHSIPISINLAMNSIVKTLNDGSYSISISNTPLQPPSSQFDPSELSGINVTSVWLIMIPLSMFFFMTNFIVFPNTEISTDFIQIQMIAGIKTYFYWFTNIIFDLIFSLIPFSMFFVLLALLNCLVYNGTAFEWRDFEAIVAILATFIIVSLPFTYLLSYRKTITGGFTLLIMFGIFVGIIPTLIVIPLEFSGQDYYKDIAKYLKPLLLIISPQFALSYISVKFSKKYVENFNWKYMDPNKRNHVCTIEPNPCCVHGPYASACSEYQSYFLNKEVGIKDDLLVMMISFAVYFLILYFLNTETFKKLVHFCIHFQWNFSYKKEQNKGNGGKVSPNRQDSIEKKGILNVENLRKSYGKKEAVKNLKFSIKENQCFGLLGVNGAGKSTTFRMLTKYLFYDNGKVDIVEKQRKESENDVTEKHDQEISIDQPEYCRKIGYCPQEDSLNYYLTGRELLTIMARLKGCTDNADAVTKTLLRLFDLEEIADKPSLEYSGGNKRRLCASMAFLGSPRVILLDEPTSGVDPASRRQFWNVLSKCKKSEDTSLLLCSHSMEECENLCDEIAIMKDGEVKTQGSLLQLKSDHPRGFKVTIKYSLSRSKDREDKKELEKLIEENETVLQKTEESLIYEVKDPNKRLSVLFEELEKRKKEYDFIEDYVVNTISLEDIFLSVAEEK